MSHNRPSRTTPTLALLCAATALCSVARETTAHYETDYDAWDIMPSNVHSLMSAAGLEQLYAAESWSQFRDQAQDFLDTADLDAEERCYVLYLMANMGDVSETHWRVDSAELQNRLQFMDEAESLAVETGVVELLEMVRDFCITVNTPAGHNQASLDIVLNAIRAYAASPSSPYPETYPMMLPMLYAWCDVPTDTAIAQLDTFATTHPVEQVRFTSLVAKGLVYVDVGNLQAAQSVASTMKSTYPAWDEDPWAVCFDDAAQGLVLMDIDPNGWHPGQQNGNNCSLCYVGWPCGPAKCDQDTEWGYRCVAHLHANCFDRGAGNCGGHACGSEMGGCEGTMCGCHSQSCYCR